MVTIKRIIYKQRKKKKWFSYKKINCCFVFYLCEKCCIRYVNLLIFISFSSIWYECLTTFWENAFDSRWYNAITWFIFWHYVLVEFPFSFHFSLQFFFMFVYLFLFSFPRFTFTWTAHGRWNTQSGECIIWANCCIHSTFFLIFILST